MPLPLIPRLDARPSGAALIEPGHPCFEWTGRIDWSDPAAPVLIWQGTELRCSFTGSKLAFLFGKARDRCFVNAFVDGRGAMLKVGDGDENAYVFSDALGPGRHELVLAKRSEASMGFAPFLGLLLERGAEVLPKPTRRALRLEFYGDSITAGACDEDPADDQYDDLSTHNHWRSYGAVAARNLGAEAVSISISGIGIRESWDPRVMRQIWDKLYCDPAGATWDFSGPAPDAVVVNLGQNDFGFPKSQWRPFPADFKEGYVDFVRGLRERYPGAVILCVIGGMRCYEESPEFRAAFDAAVAGLMASDPLIERYVFKAWAPGHPRVDVHELMANELTALLGGRMYDRRAISPRGPRR